MLILKYVSLIRYMVYTGRNAITYDTSELSGISKGNEGLNSKFDSFIIEQKSTTSVLRKSY
jgi:hypothetical protein